MYKEKVSNLLNEIDRQNQDSLSMRSMLFGAVKSSMDSFVEYVNCVYNMETSIHIARFHANSTEEYQETVSNLDTRRRSSHEAAIASVNMLNRICDKMGVERVYDGSMDRVEIGDFCGAIVNEYFEERSRGRFISHDEFEQVFEEEMGRDR